MKIETYYTYDVMACDGLSNLEQLKPEFYNKSQIIHHRRSQISSLFEQGMHKSGSANNYSSENC